MVIQHLSREKGSLLPKEHYRISQWQEHSEGNSRVLVMMEQLLSRELGQESGLRQGLSM